MAKTLSKKTVSKASAKEKIPAATAGITAKYFIERLKEHQSARELEKIQRYFKSDGETSDQGDLFIGVRMGTVFALAKEMVNMPLKEIEKLLESPIHEVRTGAVSIMDFQARDKRTPEGRKEELFNLYIRRHDRINNWDLVDRSAPYVVGGYLFDKPRKKLYQLARSKDVWERRTSIVSTFFFIRQGDVNDTFKIATLLLKDKHDLIHKAVGGWIREAGKRDRKQLIDFLNMHASTMPRTMLRYAIEHFDKKEKRALSGFKAEGINRQFVYSSYECKANSPNTSYPDHIGVQCEL